MPVRPRVEPEDARQGRSLPADEIFLDLEDSVAPPEKNDKTRQNVVDALLTENWLAKTRAVRINGVNTRWWLRDLLYVVEGAGATLDCVMLPKVEGPSQAHAVDHVLSQLGTELDLEQPIGIEVQIESPRGLVEIERIAGASRRTETLIFGPGDFAASTGIPQLSVGAIDVDYSADQWHYVLFRIVRCTPIRSSPVTESTHPLRSNMSGLSECSKLWPWPRSDASVRSCSKGK